MRPVAGVQVKYRAARQYAHAARQAAGNTDGAAFQDRAYQVLQPLSLDQSLAFWPQRFVGPDV